MMVKMRMMIKMVAFQRDEDVGKMVAMMTVECGPWLFHGMGQFAASAVPSSLDGTGTTPPMAPALPGCP